MMGFADKRKAAVETAMKDAVYEAAVRILTEEGFGALTLDRIAKAIGVSRPTLYNYFNDRAAVVNFVEDRAFAPLVEMLDEVAASKDSAIEKLDKVCRAVLNRIVEERALVMALFQKEMPDSEILQGKKAKRDRALARIEQILRDGVAAGEFRPIPVEHAAQVVMGCLTGIIDTMVFSGDFKDPGETLPPMLDVLVRGLRAEGAREEP